MHTEICDQLGIEFPIFAFTHCRDVVAAVSNAGGIGVLGAIGFSPEELALELAWLDEHVGDKPYGVDIVIPGKYEGMGETDPVKLEAQLQSMVPDDHRRFARRLLEEHGVPETPADQRRSGMMGWTEATGKPLLAEALRHDKVRLIANALGTPPADVVKQVKSSGRMIGALAGSAKHARGHKAAGLDFIVCQGTEGGGHTGEIGSLVLWPEVIDAVAPLPVLAAGGVGTGRQIAAALAMGAQGVWTGTLWLTVEEADVSPGQLKSYLDATSADTIRSRSFTGKPCRMLKNDWTEAWARSDTPDPLPMPLQMLVAIDAVGAGRRHPDEAKDVTFNPCGQIIGRATRVRKARDVVYELVEEYIEAVDRLAVSVKTSAGASH
ncbi:MAG: nitronate monooxygenase [Acidimicrobiales bacterium]